MCFLSLAAPCGKSEGSERWASREGFSMYLDVKSGSSFLRARTVCQPKVCFRGSDTYRWRWPVEEDSSVADGFVALDDEPDTESEEEGEGDERVDGRLWV
jgi:hypothetical protein